MKIYSTHKNLNTSYVNLSALLKFLRQRNFVGNVRFQAKGYEASVIFTNDHELKTREKDHFAGRVSVGEDALARLLIRAHEPDGIINVFDEIEEDEAERAKFLDEIKRELNKPVIDEISVETQTEAVESDHAESEEETDSTEKKSRSNIVSLKEKLGLPSLPFSFRKKDAKKIDQKTETLNEEAIKQPIEEDWSPDWHELLELTGEILQTVENSLAESNLNFVWVFDKVRSEVFEEYPFLHPNSTVFDYKNGKVLMSEQINNNLFIASIAESLRRLLEKFETHPKFAEVHRSITINLIELMNKRHTQYDKFLISQQLEKVIES